MKEKEFVRFYVVNGKIEWDRVFKDTLRVLYGDEDRNVGLVTRTSYKYSD